MPPRGFVNSKNTCYFNVTLQCLFHVPALSNYLNRSPHRGSCDFSRAYCELLRAYWRAEEPTAAAALDPTPLLREFQKHFPRFVDGEQHDVQEAVLCVIDVLERAMPELKRMFYGKKIQETIWPGGKNTTEEPFSVHLLTARPGATMETMLEDSVAWRTLDGFVDDAGKAHHVATTRAVFSELPPLLLISFDKKSDVEVFERLEIGRVHYRLVATALHTGIQWGGHYVAFCFHRGWFAVNDERVSALDGAPPPAGGHYFFVYVTDR